MKIQEITESYLTEAPSWLDSAMTGLKNFVAPSVSPEVLAKYMPQFMPQDGTTRYYDNREYTYRARDKKWIEDRTGKKAGLLAQTKLMAEYDLTNIGNPNNTLLRKIQRLEQEKEENLKEFDSRSQAAIQAAFRRAQQWMVDRNNPDAYLKYADNMMTYHKEGFNLKTLETRLRPYFDITTPSNFGTAAAAEAASPTGSNNLKLIDKIYQHVFVKTDEQAYRKAINLYYPKSDRSKTRPSAPTRNLEPDDHTKVLDSIKQSFTNFNIEAIKKIPNNFDLLRRSGIDVTDYYTEAEKQLTALTSRVSGFNKVPDVDKYFDILLAMKPALPSGFITTHYKPTLDALDFNTMFATPADAATVSILTNKRTEALKP